MICQKCRKTRDSLYSIQCECGGFYEWEETDELLPIPFMQGNTPILKDGDLCLKLEFFNPTLSFKDRGMAHLVAFMKEQGIKQAMIDSSGNAAISLAAYAKRIQCQLEVFISSNLPESKKQRLRDFDVVLHEVKGDRSEVQVEAMQYYQSHHIFYASHVYEPYFHRGIADFFIELPDDSWNDTFYLPVGNGTFLFGLQIACQMMKRSFPDVVIVQPQESSALNKTNGKTLATGVSIPEPPRLEDIKAFAKRADVIFISEAEIVQGYHSLIQKGIYADYTAAMTYQAAKIIDRRGVVPICGSGERNVSKF